MLRKSDLDQTETIEPEKSPDSTILQSDESIKDHLFLKNTSFQTQKSQRNINATFQWGTYKPHLIHAITQRSPKPLSFGFMYGFPEEKQSVLHSYRDIKALKEYFSEYLCHNGKSCSESIFVDRKNALEVHNYFYKEISQEKRQKWHSITTTQEKSAINLTNNYSSLIYYFLIEDFDGLSDPRFLEFDSMNGIIKVRNSTTEESLDYFKLVVYDKNNKRVNFSDVHKYVFIDTNTPKNETWKVQSIIRQQITSSYNEKLKTIINNYNEGINNTNVNLIAIQIIVNISEPFTTHVIYDQQEEFDDKENNYPFVKNIPNTINTIFSQEFTENFPEGKIEPRYQACAKSALSNLLSGIGYYYGNIQIHEDKTEQPKQLLFTGCPSKTEFPRGFLWDEGFHGLVYSKWNKEICLEVLIHWLDTQLEDGWIPREQLRGNECISNGHPDYIKQKRNEANPPTLMFLVKELIEYKEKGELTEEASERLFLLYPRLKKWFEWFCRTQASENEEGLFVWRSDRLGSNLVLGSGLDDYPRGLSYGKNKARGHLDLQVWMLFMTETMIKVAELAGKKEDVEDLKEIERKIRNGLSLFLDKDFIYKDLITDENQSKGFSPHFGYVNLFPLFFGYIEKDSKELEALLDYIIDEKKIWSPFGLLSLSRDDSLYMQTTDAYWGGPVWININYLVLRGLKLYYDEVPKARLVYNKLRKNIIENIYLQKEKHGYFFEQYNQDNGEGQKNFPFTGLTALVLLIIYEKY